MPKRIRLCESEPSSKRTVSSLTKSDNERKQPQNTKLVRTWLLTPMTVRETWKTVQDKMNGEKTAVWTQIQLLLHVLVYDVWGELRELVVTNISNLQQDGRITNTQFSEPAATCESWFFSNWASADKKIYYNFEITKLLTLQQRWI